MKKVIALFLAIFVMFQGFSVALADGENLPETHDVDVNAKSSSEASDYADYRGKLLEGIRKADSDIILSGDSSFELSSESPLNIDFECFESGLYALEFEYAPQDSNKSSFDLDILIDGKIPFSEAEQLVLPCFYTMSEITVNNDGNDVRPNTEIDTSFHKFVFYDENSSLLAPYEFYLSKGTHSILLKLSEGKIKVSNIKLYAYNAYPTYDEYISKYSDNYSGEALPLIEAENFLFTNSNYVIASSEPGSAETTPSDPIYKKINVVGGSNWKNVGDLIAWQVIAPEDGLYNISFRYKQSFQSGLNSYRTLYVNGEIPFEEATLLGFKYDTDWQVSDFNYKIYLNKGENTVALVASMGEIAAVLENLSEVISDLNDIYRNIIMITGTSPDSYRDYNLQDEIPNIKEELSNIAKKLDAVYAQAIEYIDGSGSLHVLTDTSRQLTDMAGDLRSITKGSRLSRFKSNISSISSLSANLHNHPLMIDSISVYGDSDDAFIELGFWKKLSYRFKRFISTFAENYNFETDGEEVINVWIPSGRDQLQVLNDLIENDFTPKTGIKVNLQLVTGSLIHAVLAGKEPDVSLSRGETDVINFAMRGAVEDLSKYEGYNKVISQFSDNAVLPYSYKNGVYGLPETQSFQMMFVRTDILSELGLEVPDTWDEVIKNLLPALNRNNLTIGIGVLNTAGALQSIYTTVLTQMGGSLYTDDLLSADLTSQKAFDAFDFVVSLYRDYGIPQQYDFINRFRTGEIPLALAPYTTYNQLQISAPELSGLWEMCEIPGIVDSDGNINRSQIMSSTAAVMLASSDKKEQSWEFLTWFTGVEAQKNFGLQIEAVLGEAGRYATANIEAMSGLLWQSRQLATLELQRSESTALQQVPGSYYIGKALNSATVLSVTNQDIIPREELTKWDDLIDNEITRKSKEFDFRGKEG